MLITSKTVFLLGDNETAQVVGVSAWFTTTRKLILKSWTKLKTVNLLSFL